MTYLNAICDFLEHRPSYDRVSLHMVRVSMPNEGQMLELTSVLPKEYLYYNIHEIEDATWNYAAVVNSAVAEKNAAL